jgi:hypothetical protein
MQDILKQFKSLTDDEKLAFMKEAMTCMAEIFQNDPQKMMNEMMPACMKAMASKGMNMDMMRVMIKGIMGQK